MNKKLQKIYFYRNRKLAKMGYTYQQYLESDLWKEIKTYTSKLPGFDRCFVCGSQSNLHFHHKTYKFLNNSVKRQRDGLIRLCAEHHSKVHELSITLDLNLKKPINLLGDVTHS